VRVAQVQHVQHRYGVGIAEGQRREVPLRLDQLQDRRVVEHLMRDVVATCPRRHDRERHAKAVAVEPVEAVLAGHQDRADAVRRYGRGRRHVVVVPAVLVIRQDEQRPVPVRAVDDRVDDLGRELLAHRDVTFSGYLAKAREEQLARSAAVDSTVKVWDDFNAKAGSIADEYSSL